MSFDCEELRIGSISNSGTAVQMLVKVREMVITEQCGAGVRSTCLETKRDEDLCDFEKTSPGKTGRPPSSSKNGQAS